jgi:hypothetical protein
MKPYMSNEQLIKYKCEACSFLGEKSKCEFYEAMHVERLAGELKRIKNDKNVLKPKIYHPWVERLCKDRNLKDILMASWEIAKHIHKEPDSAKISEHREWKRKECELRRNLRCEGDCKMSEWCNFYQHEINYKLVYTDYKEHDKERVYYHENHSNETDKGFLKSSFLYKNFVKPSEIKELPPIKNDKSWKKLDNWNYKVYSKISDKIKYEPKIKQDVLKYVLDILMQQDKPGELIMTYLLGLSATFNEGVMYQRWGDLEIDFNKHLETLRGMNLIGTLQQSADIDKVRKAVNRFSDLFVENSNKLIHVNISLLLKYVEFKDLGWFDVFYEWYLSLEKNPSRKDIEKIFGLNRHTQVSMEKRLGIRKDFRNIGNNQLTNLYWTNQYIISNIFQFATIEETEKILERAIIINKRKSTINNFATKEKEPNYELLNRLKVD